ncbi:alpha/beta hydrolase [Candidatus Gracilibacteria bacterium]|nr:alpha/beta hydrolase [Candidatus Gracilibacteria bacterium]
MLYFSIFLLVISIFFSLITLGVFVGGIPYISDYASIIASFFSAYLHIVSIIIFIGALALFLQQKSWLQTIIVLISIANIIGTLIPIFAVFKVSQDLGTNISLLKNLDVVLNRSQPDTSKSVVYHEVDGKKLHMDISPSTQSESKNKALVLIHGGGFIAGERGEEPVWTEYFTKRGYTVFDVGYRLANPQYHTYNKAATDINTALVWINNNASQYNLDMDSLVIVGSSAGASLALQASYGGESIFPAEIQGELPVVQKIIALFPATDMEALWNLDTDFIGINSREVGRKYVGGSPEEFPNEYDMINSAKLAKLGAPETLVIHGLADTLIPSETLSPLKQKLDVIGTKNTFVYIPYAVHGYTYFENTLGFQITRQLVSEFLNIEK